MIEPILRSLADIEPEEVRWLWPDRIPAGAISLIAGAPGAGKSFATCDLAARVSTGTAFPDGSPCEPGDVLLIACEDDPAMTMRPRLDALRADAGRITLLEGVRATGGSGKAVEVLFNLSDADLLERTIQSLEQPRLVIVDPIGNYLPGKVDAYRDNEVRAVLAPVAEVARRTGVAVVIVAHNRKSPAASADDTVMGSRAFTGIARAVHHVMPDPDDPARRLFLPGKCNLAKPPPGLAYRITGEPARIEWASEPVRWTADDAMAANAGGNDRSALQEAKEWLLDFLADGPKPAREVKEQARKDGISDATLNRAKEALGVTASKQGFKGGWVWSLPGANPKAPEDAQDPYLSTFDAPSRLNGSHFTDAPF